MQTALDAWQVWQDGQDCDLATSDAELQRLIAQSRVVARPGDARVVLGRAKRALDLATSGRFVKAAAASQDGAESATLLLMRDVWEQLQAHLPRFAAAEQLARGDYPSAAGDNDEFYRLTNLFLKLASHQRQYRR